MAVIGSLKMLCSQNCSARAPQFSQIINAALFCATLFSTPKSPLLSWDKIASFRFASLRALAPLFSPNKKQKNKIGAKNPCTPPNSQNYYVLSLDDEFPQNKKCSPFLCRLNRHSKNYLRSKG